MIKRVFTPYSGTGRRPMLIVAAAQLALLVAFWMIAPGDVFPSLQEIGAAWVTLVKEQGLIIELMESAKTAALALLIASVISVAITALAAASFFRPVARTVSTLRFLGFTGLTFIFTLMTSSGSDLKIWLLTFGMGVFILTALLSELDDVPGATVDYAHTLRLSGWGVVRETFLLGKADTILDLVRQNAAVGWTMLTMVEGLVRSDGGIGAMLLNQNRHFHLAAVFAIQLTILFYGWLQDFVLGWIRQLICPYSVLGKSN